MNKEQVENNESANTNQKTSELLDELAKVYDQALTNKNYRLCEIVRLEIRRCLSDKPLLIPAGQINGLILDPMTVLLGR